MKLSTIALTTLTVLSQSSMGVQAFAPRDHSRRSILTSSSSHQKSKTVINTSGHTSGHTSRIKHQYIHSTLFMKNDEAKSSKSPARARKRAFEQEKNMNTRKSSSSSKIDYRLASSVSSEAYAVGVEQENNNGLVSSFLQTQSQSQSTDTKKLFPIISAALLITSNTVGASMMVLPGLAQGPGMIASSGLFGGEFLPSTSIALIRLY